MAISGEQGGGALAVGLGRYEREPDVALARRPEERARGDEEPALEHAPRGVLGRLVDGEPEEERRVAAGEPEARRLERGEEGLALAAIDGPHRLDVSLVAPGGHRRALDELLRRRPERRPER